MSELDVSELARQLAAQRRTVAGQCAICHAPIVGLALRRYCSNRCRQAAKHARVKAARLERARQPRVESH